MLSLRIATILAAIAIFLSGCSAVILATGTDEETIIHRGSTEAELEKTLGVPITMEIIPSPERVWDLRLVERPINLFVRPSLQVNESGKKYWVYPESRAHRKAQYKFVGRLRRIHDSGEATSLALMTFGASELLTIPVAVSERANDQTHILTVWFDENSVAAAYKWTRVENHVER